MKRYHEIETLGGSRNQHRRTVRLTLYEKSSFQLTLGIGFVDRNARAACRLNVAQSRELADLLNVLADELEERQEQAVAGGAHSP